VLLALVNLLSSDFVEKSAFSGMVTYTSLNYIAQILILGSASLFGLIHLFRSRNKSNLEFFVLVYGILIGSMVLVLCQNYLLFYLSLETISLSSYALTYFGGKTSKEAAIKYLVFGAVSSATMLFGISLLYGLSGSLDIYTSLNMIGSENPYVVVVPVIFFLVGVFFKIGAFPFHFWLPEVYKSISYDVIGLFSTVPKIAMFTFLFTWFDEFKWFQLSGYSLAEFIAVIAIITLAIGNFSALKQKSMKGILAYSGIANTSYILIPIIVGGQIGEEIFLFYLIGYIVVLFGVLFILDKFDLDDLIDFKGLGRSHAFIGALLVVLFLSLVGLPPTVGFGAKLLVFISLWKSSIMESSTALKSLFFFGIFNTVVGLFYYFKLPFMMFIKEGEPKQMSITLVSKIVMVLFVIGSVYLFFKMDWILMLLKSLY
jgi:NADH-quinone oxidoreductase subunit N